MSEDCEDEESFTRKPVTGKKKKKKTSRREKERREREKVLVFGESRRLAVDGLILERKVVSKRQYR